MIVRIVYNKLLSITIFIYCYYNAARGKISSLSFFSSLVLKLLDLSYYNIPSFYN